MEFLPHMVALPAVGAEPAFTHDRTLVGLSLLAATLMAFAFLELFARVRVRTGVPALIWAGAAGTLLGAGIWATHFIGLLAFQSPLERGMALGSAVGSALCALVAGKIALMVAVPPPSWRRYGLGGLILAAGATAMHYWGVAGLVLDGDISFRPAWAAVTAAGTLVSSLLVMAIAPMIETRVWRLVASLPAAASVASLHYVEMAATVITPAPQFVRPEAFAATPLAIAVAGGLALLCAIAIMVAVLDERRAAREAAAPQDEHIVEIPRSTAEKGKIVVLSR